MATITMSAEALVAAGDSAAALAMLQQLVRQRASDVKWRVFLVQPDTSPG